MTWDVYSAGPILSVMLLTLSLHLLHHLFTAIHTESQTQI